jgi:hypothetical protein
VKRAEWPWWIFVAAAVPLWFVAVQIETGRDAKQKTPWLSDRGRRRIALLTKVFAASFLGMLAADRVVHAPWLQEAFWLLGFGAMLFAGLVSAAERGDEAVGIYRRVIFLWYALFAWGVASPFLGFASH